MSDKTTYEVLRQMDGDRAYLPGDRRDLTEVEAKHLVALGVLKKLGAAKSEPAPLNKSEPAPANKAETAPATKLAPQSARKSARKGR